MTQNKWGGKREGAGRPRGTNNKKQYTFRLSLEELSAVRKLLAKMRGKLIIFFCLLALCLPVSAQTLQGGVTYTEETARKEAFEGVKPLSIVYSVGWENPKYFFDLKAQNDVMGIAKNNPRLKGIPLPFNLYSVVYKDEPNKEYIYSKYYGKYRILATITSVNNSAYPQKYLKYDRYGNLLSIEFNTGKESFIYDVNRKLIGHWKGNSGKTIDNNLKINQKIIYSAQ